MNAELKSRIDNSHRIVFLGGAGVSTESGIPDFRGGNSRQLALEKYGYDPETLLSHSFFIAHPDIFFDYYINNLIHLHSVPNPAHMALAQLERDTKLTAVVTQNIDGLHQKAGSRNVVELHGSILRNYCTSCNEKYSVDFVVEGTRKSKVPTCTKCGAIVRPDVVLYEESLDANMLFQAQHAIETADLLIIGGTSLAVWPAAGLIQYFNGNAVVLINKSETPFDRQADLVIREPIGEVLRPWIPTEPQ